MHVFGYVSTRENNARHTRSSSRRSEFHEVWIDIPASASDRAPAQAGTSIEAMRLEGDSQVPWVLLVSGRGFNRLLRDEPLMSPYLHRTVDPTTARPMRFLTHKSAVRYAQSVGLMAQQTTWSLRER